MGDLLFTICLAGFAGWVGYHLGLEQADARFQEQCVQVGLYETPALSIRCDVIAQKLNGKIFYIHK